MTGVSFPELSGVQPLESDTATQKDLVDRLNLLLSAMGGRAEGGAE